MSRFLPSSLDRWKLRLFAGASFFLALSTGWAQKAAPPASKNRDPIPVATSKKGLQVQMLSDAIELGVKHASLNVDLGRLIDPAADPESLPWESQGRTFHFHPRPVEASDRAIKTLSDAGIQVTLILLNYRPKDPAIAAIMRPQTSRSVAASPIDGFNVDNPEGAAWYRATVEFLADRYSANDKTHGRVVGYVVGNEVDSHYGWYDIGDTRLDGLINNYERAVRIAHEAVRLASAHARVFLSLDRQWMKSAFIEPLRGCTSREVLDAFAKRARAGGDYDWHLAFHPYPQEIRDPRTWADRGVRFDFETEWITPRNLELLPAYMRRPEMLDAGKPRHIILSEQGFNMPDCEEGERWQAAGFCYTWAKLQRMEGIDCYILHRHVDHPNEGGLKLGLWTNKPNSTSPDRKKLMYDVFKACDTPGWEAAFAPYLREVGVRKWSEVK